MGQFLYSVYVHSGPDYSGYKENSLFYGREVPDRVQVREACVKHHGILAGLSRKALLDLCTAKTDWRNTVVCELMRSIVKCQCFAWVTKRYLSLYDVLQVKWGEHSMVEALRALLREALKDPLNQRFQLLCEYSLPLQSPLLVYQQYIKERKSRLNACNTFDWQEHVSAPPSATVCVDLRLAA